MKRPVRCSVVCACLTRGGDVFGAATCARLLAGDQVEDALRHATAMAARNATLRGAGGLSRHLRGELLVP